MHRETLTILAGAVVAVALQVVISPNIAIFQAQPSFLIVYTLVLAMIAPGDALYVTAFALGLVGDLLGYGPVGALPLILIVSSFVAARVHATFANGMVVVPLVTLMVTSMLVEMVYAVFVLAFGLQASPVDAFLYRAVPSSLYDCVIGLLLYPLMTRVIDASQTKMSSVMPGPRVR